MQINLYLLLNIDSLINNNNCTISIRNVRVFHLSTMAPNNCSLEVMILITVRVSGPSTILTVIYTNL